MAARRSREEEQRLIACAYRMQGARGLLIDTLFQASARVSEFVSIKAENGFLDEQMILTAKAKGGKSRYVPMRASLAHELRTYRGERTTGDLFETNRNTRYSPCLFQQILKETIAKAKIAAYPLLLTGPSLRAAEDTDIAAHRQLLAEDRQID
jgi:site-specific recombinase XerD